MTLISKLSFKDVVELQNKIKKIEDNHYTLAGAAQEYMSILFDELKESIILTRLFATIPYANLPKRNKEFVMDLASSGGISDKIKDDTLILSLLASRGVKPEWNDPCNSIGHVGIPLASSDFIDKIPMMSRLLNQLGAGIDWIEEKDTKLVAQVFKSISGVFYVENAETEVDNKGRKIIVAENFVRDKS